MSVLMRSLACLIAFVVVVAFVTSTASVAWGDTVRRPGTVFLSDGEQHSGSLLLRGNGEVRFFDETTGSRITLTIEDFAEIETVVENEQISEGWMFPEEGQHDREPTGEDFPRRTLRTVITLVTGQVLEGYSTFLLYVEVNDTDPLIRFKLVKEQKGDIGQTLDELVYVERVEFDDVDPEASQGGTIEGAIVAPGNLLAVRAIGRNRRRTFDAEIDARSGTYRFEHLPDDTYDLLVETDQACWVQAGLPAGQEEPTGDARALNGADEDALMTFMRDRIGKTEFFDHFQPLDFVGTTEHCLVVMLKERHQRSHLDTQEQDLKPRRLELLYFHLRGETWVLDERVFLWRELIDSAELGTPVLLAEDLAGHTIPTEPTDPDSDTEPSRTLRVDLVLER